MDPNDDMERLLDTEFAAQSGPLVKLEGATADERAEHARRIIEPWFTDSTGPYFFKDGQLFVRDARLIAQLGGYRPKGSYDER